MRLSQIALSVLDVRRSQAWHRDVLGLEPAGGTSLFAGPLASMVQGVPRAASSCWWLVDRQDLFQVELFEFRSPPVRPLPPDWRPSDVGYTTLGFHVRDLDSTLERARAAGTPPLSEPLGPSGARRVCLRDPDGVLVELMEDDPRAPSPRARPRPQVPAVARFVTLSVPSLDEALGTFAGVLGLEPGAYEPHRPEHEALWGLEGAGSRRATLWADDVAVELAEYSDPAPRGWPPGYRISDQGLLNVAFGFRERRAFEHAVRRCREAGLRPNGPVLRLGAWSVVYFNDPQGFSIELLHVEPWYERRMGFRPRATPRLAPLAGTAPARRRARRPFAKALLTGAAGGLGVELARLLAEDGTALVLVDRDRDGLERLRLELEGRVPVATQTVDQSDLEAVEALASRLAAGEPDLDLVIAGAGVDRAQSLLDLDWRQAREDFAVNALSNLVLLARLAPALAGRDGAHFTAIVSLAGLIGMPYEAPYSASKAALAAIVEAARAELEPRGVTFTAAFPGFVDTPMFRANAFKHTYAVAPREAAERIYAATLQRRAELHFPRREHLKIRLGRLLPARLRGRLTRAAMNPPARLRRRAGAGAEAEGSAVQVGSRGDE